MALVIPWKWTSSSARGVFMAGGLMMRIRWEIIGLGSHSRYKEQGSEIKSTVQTRQARTITDVCMKRNKGFRMRITTSKSKMFERIDVQRDSVYTWQLRSLPGNVTSYHMHSRCYYDLKRRWALASTLILMTISRNKIKQRKEKDGTSVHVTGSKTTLLYDISSLGGGLS